MKIRWILVGILLVVVGWYLGNVKSQVVYSSAVANTIVLSRQVADNQASLNLIQQRINLLEQQNIAISGAINNHAAILNRHDMIINATNRAVEALISLVEKWRDIHGL